ncbi:hypothetical protein [Enterovibrio sp. FF113]|uniref:hypothetical protein n=1 Tax=Enterovibrio sp. FF113 TaxID=3230010 RepID=UPI00352F589D
MRTLLLALSLLSLSACTIGVNLPETDKSSTCGQHCIANVEVLVDPTKSTKEEIEQSALQGYEINFYQAVANVTRTELLNSKYSVADGNALTVGRSDFPHYAIAYHIEHKELSIPSTVFGESHAKAEIVYELFDSSKQLLLTQRETCSFSDEMSSGETTSHLLMPFDSLFAVSFTEFLGRVWITTVEDCSHRFIEKVNVIANNAH